MTILSSAQKALINTRPQSSDLYLSIYQPQIALACRVNDAEISKSERSITYDGVTSGNYNLVEEHFIMLVGTSAGSSDKGRIRVKSATSSVITVQANSHIDWADNDYLTILRYIEIVPIYPRIIQDPSNPMNTLWYKDYDVAYTDQNSVLGSFVCMGSHYAGFVGDDIYYTASGTYNFKGDALTYDWFMEGADTTGSSAHTPGNVSYTDAGQFVTRLEVSNSSSGTADTSYRFISLYDRPGEGDNLPILQWEMETLKGSRMAGGYRTRIRIFEDIDEATIKPNALVILFGEDWWGETKSTFGGNAIGRSNTFFVGYIKEGTINWDYRQGVVEFEVVSPVDVMKELECFSIDVTSSTDPAGQAVTDKNFPSGWTLLLDMTLERVIYHYLRWHSTVLQLMDVKTDGRVEFRFPLQSFSSDRTSIYDGIYTETNAAVLGNVSSDRQGNLWLEVEAQAIDGASGSFPTTMSMEEHFWIGEPGLEVTQINELSYLEMGGVTFHGPASYTFSAYLACAPGDEPGPQGKMEEHEGLALLSQEQLNTLVGNSYAWRNAKYKNLSYYLASPFKNIDIAPQEIVSVNLSADDTPREVTFTEKPFIPQSVAWTYNAKTKSLLQNIELHEVTQGFPGDTVVIPDVPPIDVPPIDDPPPPIVPPWIPPEPPPIVVGDLFVATASEVKTSTNVASAGTNWIDRTGDLPGVTIRDACVSQNNGTTAFVATQTKIYKTSNLKNANPTWTEVYDADTNFSGLDPNVKRVVMSQANDNYVYGLMHVRMAVGSWGVGAYLLSSTDGGTTWSENLIVDGIDLSGELVILTNKGIFYTEDHPTGTSSWHGFNDGFPGSYDSATYDVVNDAYYAIDGNLSNSTGIWKATSLGGEWELVQEGSEAINKLNDIGRTCSDVPIMNTGSAYDSIYADEGGSVYCFGGAYDFWDTGCKNIKGVFYSTDGMSTITLMEDDTMVHSNHASIRWTGNFYKLYERLLMTYACQWGTGRDAHAAYTDDNGVNIEDVDVLGIGYVHVIAKADNDRIIYYLHDDDALWVSDNDGLDVTYYDHRLPAALPGLWSSLSYFHKRQMIAANGSNLLACAKNQDWFSTSTDNGDTWVTGSTTVYYKGYHGADVGLTGFSVVKTPAFSEGFYAGSESTDTRYGYNGVIYTPDLGVTWYDRTGDLLTVAGCTGLYEGIRVYKFINVGDTSIEETKNGLSTALDVGQQSPTTVYIGTQLGTYRTKDAGSTFELLLSDYQANDIECFLPQPSSDPQTKCFIKMDGGAYTTFDGSFLGNAWHREPAPYAVPLRIASHESNGWPAFLLSCRGNDTYNIVKYSGDSSITRLTGIAKGRSIVQYTGVIYWLERTDICFSDNDGMLKYSAKGDWTTFSNPVVVSPLK